MTHAKSFRYNASGIKSCDLDLKVVGRSRIPFVPRACVVETGLAK
jgi:hypothetical protein